MTTKKQKLGAVKRFTRWQLKNLIATPIRENWGQSQIRTIADEIRKLNLRYTQECDLIDELRSVVSSLENLKRQNTSEEDMLYELKETSIFDIDLDKLY